MKKIIRLLILFVFIAITYACSKEIDRQLLEYGNVITPNRDGYNDTWIVFFNSDVSHYTCKVKTLEGSMLFESKDGFQPYTGSDPNYTHQSMGWDGTTNKGELVPSGLYEFFIEYTCFDGSDYYDTGLLEVVR